MKATKTVLINCGILVILLLILEAFFGGWIRSRNNFELLNIPTNTQLNFDLEGLYESKKDKVIYTRDRYGLRGNSTFNLPDEIDILTVGGSTTDQRFISDGETWQDVLEGELHTAGLPLKVSNAGIDGQSTYGHLKNFELWFPLIPDLSPDYIIYYIGINDFYKLESSSFDELKKDNLIEILKDKSAVYNLLRKIKGAINSSQFSIGHRKENLEMYTYTDKQKLPRSDFGNFFGNRIIQYKDRIARLIELTYSIGAEPIFVTQPAWLYKNDSDSTIVGTDKIMKVGEYEINGLDYYYLLSEMNKAINEVASDQLTVIELTSAMIFTRADYYDTYHMTPTGARKVGDRIAKELIIKIKN